LAIVKGGDGRWKTIRTGAESTGRLLDSLKTLKPEEKALLRSVLEAAKNSNTKPFEALKNLEYEERPCPPEKFLEDPYYLGEIGKGTFPWIKRELPNVFYNGYDQIVCTGAQRTGKDWFSNCLTIYLIHLIMCLKEPATSYGLAKGSNLIIIAMSVTQELAKDVIFTGIVEKLKQSPWFQKFGKKINYMTDEIRFPKGLILKGSESSDMGIVGQNTVAVIIDEANLGRRTKAVHEKNQLVDRTEAIYQAVRRRIRMTFSKPGCPPTLLMTLGSRRYPSDFVERRIKELVGEKKAFVADYSVWDAKGRENFSDKYFKVLVGNEQTASRVLKDGEIVPKGMQIIDVPEDFKGDFEGDCDGALRDIGGIAVRTIAPYFSNQALLHATVDDSRTHPAKTIEWKVNESLQIDWDKLVCLRDGKFIPIMSPDKPRCVAIDLGRVRNPTGFSIGYVKGWKSVDRKGQDGRVYQENLPVVVTEFIIRISPVQGEEVKFWQVREFLFSFIQHGIPIKYAVLDHWQSDDFAQLLKDQGIDAKQVKTDIKSYETFKSAVYEGRFKCYNYKPLYDEMMLLEYDPIKQKVDIAKDEMPSHLHHDVADSACLLVNRLSNDFRVADYDPVMPTSDLPNRSGADAGHTVLAPGDTPFELQPEENRMGPLPADNVPPPSTGYGFMFDQQELGWGAKDLNPPTHNQNYQQLGNNQYVRVEIVAQEFCKRIGIENVQSVKSESIKAFLFEKGLTDPRYLTAITTHITRVYEKQVV
jgi:hypothetical protein